MRSSRWWRVSPGLQSFSARFDVRDRRGIYLDITAEFNPLTGRATWTFASVDPTTFDLPVDPDLGFLPPNKTSPQGEGFVSYTIRAKTGLPTGTRIDAQGRVVFDTNDPLNTAAIFNTIDVGPPSSTIAALPPFTPPGAFLVTWSGLDDSLGSGISTFDVFVSDNGAPFTPFLRATTETSAHFQGLLGHTYGFFSVATDHVGNRQTTPASAQATTASSSPILDINAAYVTHLYRRVLGRKPETTGLNDFLDRLLHGISREQVPSTATFKSSGCISPTCTAPPIGRNVVSGLTRCWTT